MSQGKEFTATLQAPDEKTLDEMIRGLQTYASSHRLEKIEVLEEGLDPDGGYRAIIVAHNWNPFKWIREKWEARKKPETHVKPNPEGLREIKVIKASGNKQLTYTPTERLYNVEMSSGKVIFGNIESKEEAYRLFERASKSPDVLKTTYKGQEVELTDPGGYISEEAIDKEIEDFILDLNQQGFTTLSSCAGHESRGHTYGYITFTDQTDIKDESLQQIVSSIAREHGLSNIRFEMMHGAYPSMSFSPVGNQQTNPEGR